MKSCLDIYMFYLVQNTASSFNLFNLLISLWYMNIVYIEHSKWYKMKTML